MPHPEVHMNTVADIPNQRAWRVQLVDSLEGMTKNFANPYIIFYPVVSRTGAPFPINRAIREIQGRSYSDDNAWRGNIIVAKYRGGGNDPFMCALPAVQSVERFLSHHFRSQLSHPFILNETFTPGSENIYVSRICIRTA
ncbi:hypothetical protein PNOK_0376100 [Pyrrhoderma noxium]|uniref:Uncharacterized protein n=1 Tax=Pyrrhoderma noxium TaxID=2282107 RepID=A0A286UNP5_9AGAM|nr:hypothetical protein PNOK_0376100 [Pyrrhoderma noxium]